MKRLGPALLFVFVALAVCFGGLYRRASANDRLVDQLRYEDAQILKHRVNKFGSGDTLGICDKITSLDNEDRDYILSTCGVSVLSNLQQGKK